MTFSRKQKIERSFGQKVFFYRKNAFLQKQCAKVLCEFITEPTPDKILEIGCGTGFLTEQLQKKYPQSQILSIDISKEMIFYCQQKFTGYKNMSFQVADGEYFQSPEKFDLIVSNLCVQWFEHSAESLDQLRHNLTNHGKLYFSTLGYKSFQEWRQTLRELNFTSGILETPDYQGIFHEQEKIVTYKSGLDFLQNLKKIGAHQPREGYKPLTSRNLQKACRTFDTVYTGRITWHILYGCLSVSGGARR